MYFCVFIGSFQNNEYFSIYLRIYNHILKIKLGKKLQFFFGVNLFPPQIILVLWWSGTRFVIRLPRTFWIIFIMASLASLQHHSATTCNILYKLYRISDDLLIQRNKKVEAQPRLFYSSELVNRPKSYTTCSKK